MREERHTTGIPPLRLVLGIAFAAASGFLLTAGDEKTPAPVPAVTDAGSHLHHDATTPVSHDMATSGNHDMANGSHDMATHTGHAGHLMSEADFNRWVEEFYSTHPVRPGLAATQAADTFTITGTVFDTDRKVTTVVDTAQIWVGQNILWRLIDGLHTTTSGLGQLDPQAGQLFDVPMPPTSEFSFTFTQPGTFPFFCRPHEFLNMRGVVRVLQVSDVGRVGGRTGETGFVDGPTPNPTSGLAAFHFSLQEAGRVRVEVFDARGRRVATAVDRTLDPGTYLASWDGRTQGVRASAGMYYLRLQALGHRETRRLVLMQ